MVRSILNGMAAAPGARAPVPAGRLRAGLSRTAARLGGLVFAAGLVAASGGVSGSPGEAPRPAEVRILEADRAHSSIEFHVSHWGIVDVIGWFEDFDVRAEVLGGDFTEGWVEARIRPASLRMPNMEMARNAVALFDVASHPEAVFRSSKIERAAEGEYRILGDLTMKGVTRPVEWAARLNGFAMSGEGIPGFTVTTVIDRLAFGIGDEEAHPTTGVLTVGAKVRITCNLRMEDVP